MLPTAARLLRLLTLLQTRRAWSGAELTERLEVTARTLRRDVDRLRSLGYPVHSTSGTGGGYSLGAGAQLPPLQLEDDEAVAVAVGLRAAVRGTVSDLEEAAARALARLEQVLPARLRKRVTALNAAIVPAGRAAAPVVRAATLTAIAGACHEHRRLAFAYRGHAREGSEPRAVEPHRLVHVAPCWYLVAWDLARGDWRTFRVDRIAEVPTAGEPFAPRTPPAEDIAAYVLRGVSTETYAFRARVLLHAPLAEAAARVTPRSGVLEALDAHRCVAHFGAQSLEALAVWSAMIGFEFEVLEPPELARAVAELAGRLTRAAGAAGVAAREDGGGTRGRRQSVTASA